MIERQEGRGFRPRLPDDPAYWNALAARITDSAEPTLAALRTRRQWWDPLARLAPALGVGALAAALAAVIALPAEVAPTIEPSGEAFVDMFDPGDPVGAAFVSDAAPDLTVLLVARIGSEP